MSNRDSTRPAWASRLTSTVPRCHVVGSTISVTLIILIAWVCSSNRREVSLIQIGDRTVDLNEAAAIVEHADQWRKLYTVNFNESKRVAQRATTVCDWLPESVDWSETETQLQTTAADNELTLESIESGSTHVGTRVGVIEATCKLRGGYPSICRFLSELSSFSQPIACSEIKLERVPDTELHSQACRATVTLRVPFAADGTPADKLRARSGKSNSSQRLGPNQTTYIQEGTRHAI